MQTFTYRPSDKERISKLYGYGVCDTFGDGHCIGKCQDHKDCGAKPIPYDEVEELRKNIVQEF